MGEVSKNTRMEIHILDNLIKVKHTAKATTYGSNQEKFMMENG